MWPPERGADDEDMPFDAVGPQILSPDESKRLLASVAIGRIVHSDRALPFIVPVTFAVVDDDIVVRVGRRSRLATQAPGNIVAFEADDIVAFTGWSVVVTGRLERVDDVALIERLKSSGLRSWVPAQTDVYLRLRAEIVAGRRLLATNSAVDLA